MKNLTLNIGAFAAAVAAMLSLSAGAITLDEAKSLYNIGNYADAVDELEAVAAREPKNAIVNQMAGIALFNLGREAEAVKYLKLGQNESNLYLAQAAMHRYDFDQAEDYLDRYEAGFRKGGKRGAAPEREEATEIREQIERGRSMMDRVEKIVIVDSLDVDRDTFFEYMKLSASSGALRGRDFLPRAFEAADPTVVYVSENGDNIYWAAPDSAYNFRITTSTLLADDSWEPPTMFSDILNEGGEANFPFMMSDGVTLYYANTGENSLGGYDIFISRRDGDDFLQPQNMGMPYNSYANDYMLAIDEESGIGWWATDRNAAPDRVTVYMFVPGDLRINYPVDHPDLARLALVADYRATWQPGRDYADVRAKAASLGTVAKTSGATFSFAIPGRGVYTKLDDFKTREGRQAMTDYLTLRAKLETEQKRVAALRKTYSLGKKSVSDEIATLETEIDSLRRDLRKASNAVVNSELRN